MLSCIVIFEQNKITHLIKVYIIHTGRHNESFSYEQNAILELQL